VESTHSESVGVRVLSPLSLIADWTGQDLMLGASIVPFVRLPLFIAPAFADVTGSAGDGARFVLGVGMDSTSPSIKTSPSSDRRYETENLAHGVHRLIVRRAPSSLTEAAD